MCRTHCIRDCRGIIQYQYLVAGYVLYPLNVDVLLHLHETLTVILIDLLHLLELLLPLILRLPLTHVVESLPRLLLQIVYLLLEYLIHLLLIHLSLLLARKANSTRELLHLTLDPLGDCL
jgi:hypothetical protein